jgi:hypothetical protein
LRNLFRRNQCPRQRRAKDVVVDESALQWTQMAKWADLESLFNMLWTMPKEDMLWNFLQTREATEDGRILGWICGQEIIIDQVIIHKQLGISKEGAINVANATFEEVETALKTIVGP